MSPRAKRGAFEATGKVSPLAPGGGGGEGGEKEKRHPPPRPLATVGMTVVIKEKAMKQPPAEILREYGPFPGVDAVHGVTYDGESVWFASGDKLNALDPANGKVQRTIDVAAHAGTALDGRHLFQISEDRIQ